MRIQVILYQTNLDGIGPGGHEFLTKLCIFFLGALRISQISIVYRAERQWRNQFRASLAVIVRKPSPTACSSAGRSRALATRRNAFSLLPANSLGWKSGE